MKKRRLHLVADVGASVRGTGWRYGIARAHDSVRSIQALVVEDDTWRVLGANPEFRPTSQHPIRLMSELETAEPLEPGSLFVEEGSPVRIHAVIHDLEQDPICRLGWITQTLVELLRLVESRRYSEIMTPLLGVRHGKVEPARALALLDRALTSSAPPSLSRVWLTIDPRR